MNWKLLIAMIATTLITHAATARQPIEGTERTFPVLFETGAPTPDWTVVDDRVMGGVSRSSFAMTSEGTFLFRGNLSLANNGGFGSVRTRPTDWNLGGTEFFQLRVKGDGNRYQLRFRSNNNEDGVSYIQPFETVKDEYVDIFLRTSDFVPSWRGNRVSAPPFDPASIRQIGFMITDKQEGEFALEVAFVRAIVNDPSTEQNDTAAKKSPVEIMAKAISIGAPLYNAGNHEACAAAYEMTVYTLLNSETPLAPDVTRALRKALREAEGMSSSTDRAWVLRFGMDEAMSLLLLKPTGV